MELLAFMVGLAAVFCTILWACTFEDGPSGSSYFLGGCALILALVSLCICIVNSNRPVLRTDTYKVTQEKIIKHYPSIWWGVWLENKSEEVITLSEVKQ